MNCNLCKYPRYGRSYGITDSNNQPLTTCGYCRNKLTQYSQTRSFSKQELIKLIKNHD